MIQDIFPVSELNVLGSEGKFQVMKTSELVISRACRQFVYDYSGLEYLDCVNGISHVGHCHPKEHFILLFLFSK